MNARVQSDNLIEFWTKTIENSELFSDGKFREVVVTGIKHLEKNSDFIPDTYQTKKPLKFLGIKKEEKKKYIKKHKKLKKTAKEIVTVIRASRHSNSTAPVANASNTSEHNRSSLA